MLALAILLILVLLSGCSNTNEQVSDNVNDTKNKTPESLETLRKEITDLVAVPPSLESGQLSNVEGNYTRSAASKRNRYLDQKQARLANVSAAVIEKYQYALSFMKNKQWQKAEQLFDQILAIQPELSGAYVNKALIAIQKKEFSLADKQAEHALAVNPINPYAHQIKARVARLTGNFEQAEKSYLKALDIWPEYPEAQLNLAILLELYRGRFLDARKYYLQYLATQTEDIQVQRWLAAVEIKIKRAGLTIPQKTSNDLSSNIKNNQDEGS